MLTRDLIKKCSTVIQIIGQLPKQVFDLCTDSRIYKKGEVFVALNGEKFRGIDFAEDIIKKGGLALVVEDETEKLAELCQKYPQVCFVVVEDTLLFYQELAKLYARDWKKAKEGRLLIGITGSNGKTTNKEMLAHFLQSLFPDKVAATYKNFNNHVGVPKTLFSLDESIDIAIVEMGMNHKGEMNVLVNIAEPNAGLITNVGTAHIEFFNSQEGIFEEKNRLFYKVMEETQNEGLFILPGEDEYLACLPKHKKVFFWGERGQKTYCPLDVEFKFAKTALEFELDGRLIRLENQNLVGKHNFKNLLATFLLAYHLFPQRVDDLIKAAEHFIPSNNRSMWVMKNNAYYFMDCYNANPSSMEAALRGIIEYFQGNNIDADKQFYILGDMFELGVHSEVMHKKIGSLLKDLNVRHVAFIGRYSSFYQEGFEKPCHIFKTKSEFESKMWDELQTKFQYFFVKGSRSMELETLISAESSHH